MYKLDVKNLVAGEDDNIMRYIQEHANDPAMLRYLMIHAPKLLE